jgi:hypothetical protein
MNLKYRIAIILALIAASIWTLFPRTVVERVKRNGVVWTFREGWTSRSRLMSRRV